MFRNLAFFLIITGFVIGFLGNLLCIVAIACTKLIQNPFNKYLLVLLISDTLFILWIFEGLSTKVENRHFLTCVLLSVLPTSTICAGSIMIAVLTMERFFAIVFPLWHMQYGHINRWLIILLALLPMQLYSIYFILVRPYFGLESFTMFANGTCNQSYRGIFYLQLSTIPFHISIFAIPLLAVIFVNVAIIIKLRQRRNSKTTSDKSSGGETLWLLPIIHTALSTPLFVMIFIKQFFYQPTDGIPIDDRPLRDIILALLFLLFRLDFIYHWVFYAFSSKSFRKTFISFWFRICRKTRGEKKIDSSNAQDSSVLETCT